ncbi:phage/plasmid primase, P4 family [Thalassobaculum litoreum]|uniref:Phage/plasmid primase, P4 family, C-terminal domain-containing protein n=1 Tax=Thalassobaculum litoreum DSM 18839 TaxID=1123362 RepID=A0A8G2BLH7_9PROT|nr:phage/plasmid primase, P4 family [Thalassobaculum litoreum]SDG17467.1 phage/plasmid primase, P4 family, C-terminal domain-containing protein [Thalassobaculum litoreum DSM 18839]
MSDLHDDLEQALEQAAGLEADLPPAFSEEALARQYTAEFADSQKWVEVWGAWMIWTGTHWARDTTRLAENGARLIATRAAGEFQNQDPRALNTARRIASAKTVQAIERLAKSSREFASRPEDWDADLWVFNTPAGTIDLRTGDMRPHAPGDLLTKVAAVGLGGAAPRWLAFLSEIFDGDQETIDYVQRIFGYALSGSCEEHALFFCYGTGGNGKGVLLNTVQKIFASYSATAAVETFTSGRYERHPTELAMLKGCRLVISQETEEGQRWAEARIKAVTGGDEITARFMRQDFFQFTPQFTLVIAGNHKPALRNIDEAIRRRMNLIPFNKTIPAHRRDPTLPYLLKEEWPGILSWMVTGCLDWQRKGLTPSRNARSATAEYLDEEDALGRYLLERCETSKLVEDRPTPTQTLFEDWKDWCEAAGEYAGSLKRFSQRLVERGFEKRLHPVSRQSCFSGLRLRDTPR